jgi:hypothetical protein
MQISNLPISVWLFRQPPAAIQMNSAPPRALPDKKKSL